MLGSISAAGEPVWIVMVPNEAVAADLHAVQVGIFDDLVGTGEIKGCRTAANDRPFHRVFGFDHIEFARESFGVGRFREKCGADCRPDEAMGFLSGASQRGFRCRGYD